MTTIAGSGLVSAAGRPTETTVLPVPPEVLAFEALPPLSAVCADGTEDDIEVVTRVVFVKAACLLAHRFCFEEVLFFKALALVGAVRPM